MVANHHPRVHHPPGLTTDFRHSLQEKVQVLPIPKYRLARFPRVHVIPDQPFLHTDPEVSTIAAIYKEAGTLNSFQGDQTEPQDQDFRGNQRQRRSHPDLDSIDCHPGLEIPQMRSRLKWSLSNLVALLRLNLFVHRDLCAWIDEPYQRRGTISTPFRPPWPSLCLANSLPLLCHRQSRLLLLQVQISFPPPLAT